MDVHSSSPLPVTSVVWQPRPGAFTLTVICKATYLLRPGEATLAVEQEPIHAFDAHWDMNPARSVRAAADVVPVKRHADVTLVGHAHAPSKQPVRSLIARLLVGDVDKAVEAVVDRVFAQDGSCHEGPRFTRMPLVYERAGGGPDTTNPVGVRRGARDGFGKVALPNLQRPGLHVASADDYIEPIGFGPIASSWPERAEKMGRTAQGWPPDQWRRVPLPEDMDFACFSAAPRDQRLSSLREDERIVLENLHPDHPRFATNLPGIRPRVTVEARGSVFALPVRCDTLWIDTDRWLCTLTWRGQMHLHHASEAGRIVVTLEGGPTRSAEEQTAEEDAPAQTMSGDALLRWGATALPFAPAQRPQEAPVPPRAAAGTSPGAAPMPAGGLPFFGAVGLRETASGSIPPPGPATPFAMPSAIAPAPNPPPSSPGYPPPPSPTFSPQPPAPVAPSSSPWAVAPPREVVAPTSIGASLVAAAGTAVASAPAPDAKDGGALAASNAAAAAATPAVAAPRQETPVARAAPAGRTPRAEVRDVVQIIWFDPEAMPRIRRKPPWRALLDALEEDGKLDPDADDPAHSKDPEGTEDRRHVFEILAKGDFIGAEGIDDALAGGVRDDGRYVAPLVLCGGELAFGFDELEVLKATVTTVTPLVGTDEGLRGAVETAKEFFKTPELRSSPAVAEGLTTRIRDAFAQARRAVPAGYLDAQVERVLLEQRQYQRRDILGAPHIRALLHAPGAAAPIPAYLPDAAAKRLPLFQRFRVRLIARAELAVDQYESHAAALIVAALARLAPAPSAAARPRAS